MIQASPASVDPARCPLCGGANHCQLCSSAAYKGPCWCMEAEVPAELLARVPKELQNRACICQSCVRQFHQDKAPTNTAGTIRPGDFYFDKGLMVFTAQYHVRRGHCCGNGCRHCPYPAATLARA